MFMRLAGWTVLIGAAVIFAVWLVTAFLCWHAERLTDEEYR